MRNNGTTEVTRRQFSIESARRAASSGRYSTAIQHYLLVLPSLSATVRDSILPEFLSCIRLWLYHSPSHLPTLCSLLPAILHLFPHSEDVHFALLNLFSNSEDKGMIMSALAVCDSALAHFPASSVCVFRICRENLRYAAFDQWHIQMINDHVRNGYFEEAMKKTIRVGDVVMDIGAGTGLLSVIAARYTNRVMSIEENAVLCKICEEVARKNNAEDRIHIVCQNSRDLDTSKYPKANVIVAELLDCCVFGEDAVGTLLDAHQRLVQPNATFIPASAEVYVQLFESDDIYSYHFLERDGLYLSECASTSSQSSDPYSCIDLSEHPAHRFLSAPISIASVDFSSHEDLLRCKANELRGRASITADRAGTLHAFAVHFRAKMCNDVIMDSSEGTAWDRGIFPLQKPIEIKEGNTVHLQWQVVDNKLRIQLEPISAPVSAHFLSSDVLDLNRHLPLLETLLSQIPLQATFYNMSNFILPLSRKLQEVTISETDRQADYIILCPIRADGSLDGDSLRHLRSLLPLFQSIPLIVPSSFTLRGFLISSPRLRLLCRPHPPFHCSVDLSPILPFSLPEYTHIHPDLVAEMTILSEEFDFLRVSMNDEVAFSSLFTSSINKLKVKCSASGEVDGLLYWLQIGDTSTRSLLLAAFVAPQSISVQQGQEVELSVYLSDANLIVYFN